MPHRKPPHWRKDAVMDPRGWKCPKRGEILKRVKFTAEDILEFIAWREAQGDPVEMDGPEAPVDEAAWIQPDPHPLDPVVEPTPEPTPDPAPEGDPKLIEDLTAEGGHTAEEDAKPEPDQA